MKRILCGIASATFLATPVWPIAHAQTSDEDVIRRVIEAVAAYSQAENLAALDTLFASDRGMHIIEGAGVNHGWVDYRDHHLAPELEQFENYEHRNYAVEPQIRGNLAWTSYRYEIAVDTPGGHMEIEGRGTAVLEKRNGRWLIVHLHTSGRRKPSG